MLVLKLLCSLMTIPLILYTLRFLGANLSEALTALGATGILAYLILNII